jgi:hypothetical protein
MVIACIRGKSQNLGDTRQRNLTTSPSLPPDTHHCQDASASADRRLIGMPSFYLTPHQVTRYS